MIVDYNTNIYYIDSSYKKGLITHTIVFLDGTNIKEYYKVPLIYRILLDKEFIFDLSYLYICSKYNVLE